jgi:hypothetical protein
LLYGLHELDIADKHKLLVPVGNAFNIRADDMKKFGSVFGFVEGEGPVGFADLETDVMVTAPVGRVIGPKPARPVEQKTEFQPPFSVCFGRDQPFTTMFVVPTLIALSRETKRTVAAIRTASDADTAEGFSHGKSP